MVFRILFVQCGCWSVLFYWIGFWTFISGYFWCFRLYLCCLSFFTDLFVCSVSVSGNSGFGVYPICLFFHWIILVSVFLSFLKLDYPYVSSSTLDSCEFTLSPNISRSASWSLSVLISSCYPLLMIFGAVHRKRMISPLNETLISPWLRNCQFLCAWILDANVFQAYLHFFKKSLLCLVSQCVCFTLERNVWLWQIRVAPGIPMLLLCIAFQMFIQESAPAPHFP